MRGKSLEDKRYQSSPFITVDLRFIGRPEDEGVDSLYGRNSQNLLDFLYNYEKLKNSDIPMEERIAVNDKTVEADPRLKNLDLRISHQSEFPEERF